MTSGSAGQEGLVRLSPTADSAKFVKIGNAIKQASVYSEL